MTKKTTPALSELRAEIDKRAIAAGRIMAALRAGDMAACEAAQKAMRAEFPSQS